MRTVIVFSRLVGDDDALAHPAACPRPERARARAARRPARRARRSAAFARSLQRGARGGGRPSAWRSATRSAWRSSGVRLRTGLPCASSARCGGAPWGRAAPRGSAGGGGGRRRPRRRRCVGVARRLGRPAARRRLLRPAASRASGSSARLVCLVWFVSHVVRSSWSVILSCPGAGVASSRSRATVSARARSRLARPMPAVSSSSPVALEKRRPNTSLRSSATRLASSLVLQVAQLARLHRVPSPPAARTWT